MIIFNLNLILLILICLTLEKILIQNNDASRNQSLKMFLKLGAVNFGNNTQVFLGGTFGHFFFNLLRIATVRIVVACPTTYRIKTNPKKLLVITK